MKVYSRESDVNNSVIETVLNNRNISKELQEYYLKPTKELMPDFKKLNNIYEGVALLENKIYTDNNIGILVDSDYDGLTSSAIFYKFLTNYCNVDKDRIKLILPRRKSHGIRVDDVLEVLSSGDLLITPDSSSSDFNEHIALFNENIQTLVVDHHLAPKEETPAIIINNQLSDEFPNKSLTGSAMSYLFCKAYQYTQNKEEPKDLLDLAAMGMIADRADFSQDLGAYYMMREGLKAQNIHSKLLKKVIEKNSNLEADTDLNAKDIGFNVSPLFNAVFRMGEPEELEQVIHGICEFDYELFNKRKKINQHIIEEAYLRAMAVKRRQKKQEDEMMEKVLEHIKEKGSDKYKILIVNTTNMTTETGLNGLVAMKLVREYNKPVLLVKQVGDKFKGSARNISNSPIPDLNTFLSDTGYFKCAGHANAFGVEFEINEAMAIQSMLEDKLQDIDFNDAEYEVDFHWTGYADSKVIYELSSYKDMWCNGLDEPLIYLENIPLRKDNLNFIGKTGNTLKLEIQGVDCVKFRLTEEEKREIATASDNSVINLVCTASVNSFKGRNTPQLLIEDFEVKTNSSGNSTLPKTISLDELPF